MLSSQKEEEEEEGTCLYNVHGSHVCVEFSAALQTQVSQQLLRRALQQLVEDVEVVLPRRLRYYARLLQQVVAHYAPHRGTLAHSLLRYKLQDGAATTRAAT